MLGLYRAALPHTSISADSLPLWPPPTLCLCRFPSFPLPTFVAFRPFYPFYQPAPRSFPLSSSYATHLNPHPPLPTSFNLHSSFHSPYTLIFNILSPFPSPRFLQTLDFHRFFFYQKVVSSDPIILQTNKPPTLNSPSYLMTVRKKKKFICSV